MTPSTIILSILTSTIALVGQTISVNEDSSCNFIDNAEFSTYDEGIQYLVPVTIGVCVSTYVLPIDDDDDYSYHYQPSDNSFYARKYRLSHNHNSADTNDDNDDGDDHQPLGVRTANAVSVSTASKSSFKINAEINADNNDVNDENFIKSFQFVCSSDMETVYYQSYTKDSNCNQENMVQQLIVNSTDYNCAGTQSCDYVEIRGYELVDGKDNCNHTEFYLGDAFVVNRCMEVQGEAEHSLVTCDDSGYNTTYYGNILPSNNNCSDVENIIGDKYSIKNGCNVNIIDGQKYYFYQTVDCSTGF